VTREKIEDAFRLRRHLTGKSHLIILKALSFLRNNKMAEKNYYKILGIEKTDDHEVIA